MTILQQFLRTIRYQPTTILNPQLEFIPVHMTVAVQQMVRRAMAVN